MDFTVVILSEYVSTYQGIEWSDWKDRNRKQMKSEGDDWSQSTLGGEEYSPAINHYEPMSYSQEVMLKLTIKGTLNGLKTIINTRDLNKLLDTTEGRATLLDKGRFEIREVSHARTMDASPDATFID